ncbi:MAG: hypothetical protein CMO81_02620 [Waddliaceae bacterium]|nr:hypothetical protein [Waddliaceae bacterium]
MPNQEAEIAVLFDWDGVIVHSAPQHEASWELLADEEGRKLPPGHFLQGFGMKNTRIIPEILKWTDDKDEIMRLSNRKEELYRGFIRNEGIDLLPGVLPFLDFLHRHKVPCCVASSTDRKNILCIMEQTGITSYFEGIVSAEDVSKGKPDPEVFMKAAELLSCAPNTCVVIEDAPVGIQAGKAAGMKVLAVQTSHEKEKLKQADAVLQRLDEMIDENLHKPIQKVFENLFSGG